MRLGVCTGITSYQLVQNCGFDTIAFAGKDIAAMDDSAFENVVQTVKKGPLRLGPMNAFCPGSLALNGDQMSLEQVSDYTELLCKRAQKLGVTSIGVGSPKSRNVPTGYPAEKAMESFLCALTAICQCAEKYQIDILLEAVSYPECNFVNTTEEAAEIVQQMEIDNLRLVFDIYHAFRMGEDPTVIQRVFPMIQCVHIAGGIGTEHDFLDSVQMKPLLPYLDELKRLGYDGELLLEAFPAETESGLISSFWQMYQWSTAV